MLLSKMAHVLQANNNAIKTTAYVASIEKKRVETPYGNRNN